MACTIAVVTSAETMRVALIRTVEDGGGREAGHAQCGEQGRRVPAPVGGVVDHALAPLPTPSGEPDRSARHFHPETRAARDPRSGRSAATPPGPLPSSSRACSVACTVFFQAAAELRDRPPDRREARRRRQRLLPLHQRPIRLLPDQDREPRQLRGQARRPPPRLAARRDLTRLAPPRLQAVDPRPTHRILLRHQLRRHAGVAVPSYPRPSIQGIRSHQCPPSRRSTTTEY